MGETMLFEYIDMMAIKILRCNKVEDAMKLAEKIVNDTTHGIIRAVRVKAVQMCVIEDIPVRSLIDAIDEATPYFKK